nr:hypothetical protein B0A51_10446 [Rachicladosporium sp. CCFEE 5018]
MSGHRRVKDIDYDEEDLYDEVNEDDAEPDTQAELTPEDQANFATLTPVVRAELDEAGLQASDREIQDALWNYYWDVGKSVGYLRGLRGEKVNGGGGAKKEKVKSKFEEVEEERARKAAGGWTFAGLDLGQPESWFHDVTWSHVPEAIVGDLIIPTKRRPSMLGGSSKLAKLAEERKRKVEAAKVAATASSFDHLTLDGTHEQSKGRSPDTQPAAKTRKYPARRKEPSPPPKLPEPEPEQEVKEALPDLRAPPTAFGHTLSRSSRNPDQRQTLQVHNVLGSSTSPDAFSGPSPDDIVTRAQGASRSLNNTKSKPQKSTANGVNGLPKSVDALHLNGTSAEQSPVQPKVKSKNMDVTKIWTETAATRRPVAAFVVIGHVDHGKSTLMGRLLLDTGAVHQRDIDRYRKEATEQGKASFALAWVMDTSADERERGVTVDIAQHHFSTDTADFTILDAPGHRDFVPNMIGGASMADIGVLVVDANQLESGLKGQTREHVLLARAVGLERIVVAVNKMDGAVPAWDQHLFRSVSEEVRKLLTETGFDRDNIKLVPCSGLNGDNVATPPAASGPTAWVTQSSQTLISALEDFAGSTATSSESLNNHLRLQVTDIFHASSQHPISVSGRISAGTVQIGETITIMPSSELASIKAIDVADSPVEYAIAGQLVTLHLTADDIEQLERNIRIGDMLCSSSSPIEVVSDFTTTLLSYQPLLPGPVEVHIGRLQLPGRITSLLELVDAAGGTVKRKPRIVKAGLRAKVKVTVDRALPGDEGDRVVIRADGETLGSGTISKLGERWVGAASGS